MKILAAWIGTQDLDARHKNDAAEPGPIGSALGSRSFDRVILIANQSSDEVLAYIEWLKRRSAVEIILEQVVLADPTDLETIHTHTVTALETHIADLEDIPELTFHLSPGTWAMASVWTILSTTRFPAELIQSSIKHGVRTVEFPFELSAELLPKILKPADKRLSNLSTGLANETYGDLVFRGAAMARLAEKAGKAAQRSVPILIEGETGTEKELLARSIHELGPRKSQAFVSMNCSAFAGDFVEAELFGAASEQSLEANQCQVGAIERADKGTLYLEEIEALPLDTQSRLQRFLETGVSPRLGSSEAKKFEVRVIAATGRSLVEEVASGRFKEELFYGLAVLVLKLPSLRERSGDLGLLIEMLLSRINEQSVDEPGYVAKTLSPAAKSFLMQQPWPGNLRELENTLRRAAVWSDGEQITEADIWDSVFSLPTRDKSGNGVLGHPIEEGVDLNELMTEVARHYIRRAIEHAEGNKTIAAKLVGLPSYQTLSNWMKKYEVV